MEMSQRNSLQSYFQQAKLPFIKNGEQEGKTGPIWGLVPVGGKDIGKGVGGECSGNIMH
jgi:hypothetical protein